MSELGQVQAHARSEDRVRKRIQMWDDPEPSVSPADNDLKGDGSPFYRRKD